MVVSDSLTYGEVFAAVEQASSDLGRTINPTVYTSKEFARSARVRPVPASK